MTNSDIHAFVDVFHPLNTLHAGHISEALKEKNLQAYVNNEHFFNTGAILGTGADTLCIMVLREHADEARAVIEDLGLK